MKKRPVNRIDEEWVSVDCLVHYMRNVCKCSDVRVRKVTDDPPDFWIAIDGDTFAAEVTSVVTDAGYRARGMALKDVIKRSMCEGIGNRGTYALLTTRQPELPKRNTREWNALVAESLAFIRDTREMTSTDQHPLIGGKNGRLGIQKLGNDGATVGMAGVASIKSEGEVQNELCGLMQRAILTKRGILEKKKVLQQCSGIMLLLYDAYGYAEVEDAQKSLTKIAGYDWFHSIFWAASFTDRVNELSPGEPGRQGTFLFSKEPKWWNTPTCASR